MTPQPSAKQAWSSTQWLALLLVGALATAGWVQSLKWRGIAASAIEQRQPEPASGSTAPNPTVELMGDVDLMRQVDLLTEENQRLSDELRRLKVESDKEAERAALDGSGGVLR